MPSTLKWFPKTPTHKTRKSGKLLPFRLRHCCSKRYTNLIIINPNKDTFLVGVHYMAAHNSHHNAPCSAYPIHYCHLAPLLWSKVFTFHDIQLILSIESERNSCFFSLLCLISFSAIKYAEFLHELLCAR